MYGKMIELRQNQKADVVLKQEAGGCMAGPEYPQLRTSASNNAHARVCWGVAKGLTSGRRSGAGRITSLLYAAPPSKRTLSSDAILFRTRKLRAEDGCYVL